MGARLEISGGVTSLPSHHPPYDTGTEAEHRVEGLYTLPLTPVITVLILSTWNQYSTTPVNTKKRVSLKVYLSTYTAMQ